MRSRHDLEIVDHGLQLVRDRQTNVEFPAYVTTIECKRCGLVMRSEVEEQLAALHGDPAPFRFTEDLANVRHLEDRECKLGELRTATTAEKIRSSAVKTWLRDVERVVGEKLGLPVNAKLK